MQALLDQHLEAAKQEARNIAKDFVSEPHLGRTTLYCWAFEPKGEHNPIVLDEERRFSEAERSEIYQAGELELPFVPRCEIFAEAGESEPGEPICFDPVTVVVRAMVEYNNGKREEDILFSCTKHAPEFANQEGFISMEEYRNN